MTRLLLLAFPRAWRHRYGEELSQLVNDVGLSPRIAVDLVATGLIERLRAVKSAVLRGTKMFIAPAWRHPRGATLLALVVLAPVMTFVVGSILAYQLGVAALVGPLESINAWLAPNGIVSLLLVISPVVALLLALSPLVRLELRPGESGSEAVVGLRLRLGNLAMGGLALVIGALLAWHVVVESLAERGP